MGHNYYGNKSAKVMRGDLLQSPNKSVPFAFNPPANMEVKIVVADCIYFTNADDPKPFYSGCVLVTSPLLPAHSESCATLHISTRTQRSQLAPSPFAMATVKPPAFPTFSSQTLTLTPNISLRSCRGIARARTLALTTTPACFFRLRVRATERSSPPPSPLSEVFPYVAAEWRTITKGWACAAAAVYCLSRTVPVAGRLPRALAAGGVGGAVARGGLALAALASVRAAAAYAQQALLWEAALRAAGRLRERAFERVLARDLAFFEGRGGVAAGDIAHRITDEADDVAEAVYSVLNVRFLGP